jgi:SHS2 domain-containing protein
VRLPSAGRGRFEPGVGTSGNYARRVPLSPARSRSRSTARRRRRRAGVSRTLALLGGGAQVTAAFLPWDDTGRVALDLGVRSLGDGAEQPTVAVVLVVLAAVAAVPPLVRAVALAPLLSGLATAGLALGWLAVVDPDGVPSGVVVALAAAAGLLLAAGLARSGAEVPTEAAPTPSDAAARGGDGFELLDHTADVAFRAWAQTRAGCFTQAVRALASSFAEWEADTTGEHPVAFEPASDEDLLVDLLSEVIYLVDARGALAVAAVLRDRDDGGLEGRFELLPLEAAAQVGAVPKAITYHGLEVGRDGDGWRCHVTIDV